MRGDADPVGAAGGTEASSAVAAEVDVDTVAGMGGADAEPVGMAGADDDGQAHRLGSWPPSP